MFSCLDFGAASLVSTSFDSVISSRRFDRRVLEGAGVRRPVGVLQQMHEGLAVQARPDAPRGTHQQEHLSVEVPPVRTRPSEGAAVRAPQRKQRLQCQYATASRAAHQSRDDNVFTTGNGQTQAAHFVSLHVEPKHQNEPKTTGVRAQPLETHAKYNALRTRSRGVSSRR